MKKFSLMACCLPIAVIVSIGMPNSASARVTASRLVCECSAKNEAKVRMILQELVEESKNLGIVAAVVATNVAYDARQAVKRKELMGRSDVVFEILKDMGIKDIGHAVEFLETSPASFGCADSATAMNIEFVFEHR